MIVSVLYSFRHLYKRHLINENAMGTNVIKTNESILPFFGDRMTIITGLDALGMQNTSDAAYQLLLPGLNNVTSRMRYYSFYCWLLHQYSERVGSTNPAVFRRFIRKAEYLTALVARFDTGDTSRISGSDYASKKMQGDLSDIDLNEGIYNPDMSTEKTYWKFPSGIFGQYYLGSLRDIGLITEREEKAGIYIRTESKSSAYIDGIRMTDAFEENLKPAEKELFFRCLEKDQVAKSELQQMLPGFSLANIPEQSREQKLLTVMLVQKDKPRSASEDVPSFRKETIKFLLRFLAEHSGSFNDRTFIYHCFENKGLYKDTPTSVLTGWYFYQFNEYWQIGCAAILNGVLHYIKERYDPASVFIDELTIEIAEYVTERVAQQGQNRTDITLKDILTAHDAKIFECFNQIKPAKGLDKVHAGCRLLLALYKGHSRQLDSLGNFGEKHGIIRNGAGIRYFTEDFRLRKSLRFTDYLSDFLLRWILLRHQFVAYRKMGSGMQSTQKFILEDHRVRYLAGMEESYTGPRIANLIQFMKDLKLIDDVHVLTESGHELLEELWYEVD